MIAFYIVLSESYPAKLLLKISKLVFETNFMMITTNFRTTFSDTLVYSVVLYSFKAS